MEKNFKYTWAVISTVLGYKMAEFSVRQEKNDLDPNILLHEHIDVDPNVASYKFLGVTEVK